MRYILTATADINRQIADRNFNLKKGETIELSDAGAEVAMSPMLGGAFEITERLPETENEKERFEIAKAKINAENKEKFNSRVKELMKKNKDELLLDAEGINLPNREAMKKEELAEGIAKLEIAEGDKK